MNSRQLTLDLMYLARCALHSESPDSARAENMDLSAIFQLAQAHSLSAITWAGLGRMQSLCAPGLSAQWKEAAEMATRKALLLDIGREEICAALEAAGIWYLPLKGSLLQDLYPAPGLREMSDNDILFDRTRRQDVTAIMEGLGYQTHLGNLDDHDVYTKPPVYNYEMHLTIMGEKYDAPMEQYYQDFNHKLLPGEGGPCSRRVSDEEFYIHMMAHAHHHYTHEGFGLRIFIDMYVWMQEKKQNADWAYIASALDQMGIRDFDQRMWTAARRVMGEPHALTEEDWEILDFCYSCGAYGSYASKARNKLHALQNSGAITFQTKIRYLWRRLCPDKKTCQLYFPFFARYPFLKPFFVIYRIFRALLLRRDMVAAELGVMSKSGKP